MAVPIYATPSDWLAWSGAADAPDDIVALLRTASYAVREATAFWRYLIDETTNLPADTSLAEDMRDAVCSQISALIALEVDPDAGGTLDSGFESSVGIGTARVQYTGVEAVMQARQATVQGLCPEALRILRGAAQLASVRVFG